MTTDRRRSSGISLVRPALAAAAGIGWTTLALAAHSQAPSPATVASDVACAPRVVRTMTPPVSHVSGSPIPGRRLFGTGDLVLIDRGRDHGLEVGQDYFVRRLMSATGREGGRRDPWLRVHTAGWIRLVEVTPTGAVAKVLYACDAMEPGDFLEPFARPEVPARVEPSGDPDYAQAGRVLFVEARWEMAGPPTFVVVDLGTARGLAPGQRVTFFRRAGGDDAPASVLGQGLVVVALPDTSTVRIERVTEPVLVGDRAAPHRR